MSLEEVEGLLLKFRRDPDFLKLMRLGRKAHTGAEGKAGAGRGVPGDAEEGIDATDHEGPPGPDHSCLRRGGPDRRAALGPDQEGMG